MHEVDSTLTVLESAGIQISDRFLESFIKPSEQRQIEALPEWSVLANRDKKVLIHAAAAHPDKLYPLESWAKIVKTLAQEHGYLPVFTGAEQDVPLYNTLQELAQVEGVNLAGKLSLRQSLALYANLNLAICTDSGPAHLAAAAGIPTIALFGPTDPVRWRPYAAVKSARQRLMRLSPEATVAEATVTAAKAVSDRDIGENEAVFRTDLECRPCNYNKTCIDRPCLQDLTPEIVVAKALALLERWQSA
jgi:ADP-heptose:LPS heptosyltransferase